MRVPNPVPVLMALLMLACGGSGGGSAASGTGSMASPFWRAPLLLEQDEAGDAWPAALVQNGQGRGLAAWTQQAAEGVSTLVVAERTSGGWSPGQPVQGWKAGIPTNIHLALDDQGRACLAWQWNNHPTLSENGVFYARFTGATWGAPQQVGTLGYYPHLAGNKAGELMLVFAEGSGAVRSIKALRAAPGGVFSAPETLHAWSSASGIQPWYAKAALDPAGGLAWMVYETSHGSQGRKLYGVRQGAGGWESPVLLASAPNTGLNSRFATSLAVDGSGGAWVGWEEWALSGGQPRDLKVARYLPSSGWQIPVSLEQEAGTAAMGSLRVDGSGNAWAVWSQSDGTRTQIRAARSVGGGPWSPAETLAPELDGNHGEPWMALDAGGLPQVIWVRKVGENRSLRTALRGPGGWGTSAALGPETGGLETFTPLLATGPSGGALAVWPMGPKPGKVSVWAAEYR